MRKLGSILFFTIILIILFLSIETVHAAAANVYIGYNDINGNEIKHESKSCTVGSNYTAKAISINGYSLSGDSQETILCDEGTNIIAFVYQTKGNSKEGTVNVSCYDTKGNKLSKCTDGRSGTPGAEYYINPPAIDGYKFVRVEGPNNGKFQAGAVNVKFIYESVGGNLVAEKEPEPTPLVQETKKEETKTTTTATTKSNNNTVTTKKIVTKTNTVASSSDKKEEVKEEVVETKNRNVERSITIVDNTKDNTTKYIAIGGILSSIVLVGFVIKYSLFK